MAWAPDYVNVAELAAFLNIDDDADNVELAFACSGASRAIDVATNRQFGLVATPEARYYTPKWSVSRCAMIAPMDDLMTTTGLVIEADTAGDGTYATALSVSAYQLLAPNAATEARPWTAVVLSPRSLSYALMALDGRHESVRITARWGWTSVPAAVALAARLQASRLFKRRDAPFGIAGSPGEGSEVRLLAKVDPDVAVALRDYERRVYAR